MGAKSKKLGLGRGLHPSPSEFATDFTNQLLANRTESYHSGYVMHVVCCRLTATSHRVGTATIVSSLLTSVADEYTRSHWHWWLIYDFATRTLRGRHDADFISFSGCRASRLNVDADYKH